jgi:thiol-disulfide isomerase/thioredoxin
MKNNKQELKVILSKVAWCGHCTNFLPVFNKSQKLTKNNKYLKDTNVNFEVYDMEEDLAKFKSNNYEDLLPQINGYPTVIVTSLKNGKRVNTEIINHSTDPREFINTVGETYNKLISQSGGLREEDFFKQKYLKYKQKYIELKAQIGGDIIEDSKIIINQKCAIKNNKSHEDKEKLKNAITIIEESTKWDGKKTYDILVKQNCILKDLIDVGYTPWVLIKRLGIQLKDLKYLKDNYLDIYNEKGKEIFKEYFENHNFNEKELSDNGFTDEEVIIIKENWDKVMKAKALPKKAKEVRKDPADEKAKKDITDEKARKDAADGKARKDAADEKARKDAADEKARKDAADEKARKDAADEKARKDAADEKELRDIANLSKQYKKTQRSFG